MSHAEALGAAMGCFEAGRHDEAEALCGQILREDPGHPHAALFRAFLRLEGGRPAEALEDLDAVLARDPSNGEAHGKRGNALLALGRCGEAAAAFDCALLLEPGLVEARANRAAALLPLGRHAEALAECEAALRQDPRCVEALVNRGAALLELRREAEALRSLEAALALQPGHPEALLNRGSALLGLERPGEALKSFDAALARHPRVELHTNRALALQDLGRHGEALTAFDAALALDPDAPDPRTCRAFLKLLLGRFEEAWPDLEARWGRVDLAPYRRDFQQPQWRGEGLEGKRLLLHAEQGQGDAIHLARYVPLAAVRGAHVILEVPESLAPLMENLEGVQELVLRGEDPPPFDLHCPLASLPGAFGTTLESIPDRVPYLHPREDRLRRWLPRLPGGGLRVGLAWAGNPAHRQNRRRSLPLETLLPALARPGLQAVSLQKELRDGEAQRLASAGLLNLGPDFEDFADTAAVVSQLDLVISVDSAVAHLAGALGRPVWVLLPHQPDWRWMLGREDSPWYPSARLFRQASPGDWASEIIRVAEALGAFAGTPA
ncbi:MAG: tetratricopeptide repeat protein [Acidobacteria bacterium]|nr:tetratricopeptide repeat protein [Acidobacteriota bacterium]